MKPCSVRPLRKRLNQFLFAAAVFGHALSASAAEGASSLYVPGAAGDIAMALPTEAGFQVSDMIFVQSGDVDRAVLQGLVNAELELDVVINFTGLSYTFAEKVLGATYSVGVVVPFGNAELEASLTGPRGRTIGGMEDTFAIADSGIVPLEMKWALGNFYLELAQAIYVPTGDYDLDDRVNLGRNYWAFDTTGSMTYLHPTRGHEFSVQAGIINNLENDDTNYKTGAEFHLDFGLNQFLSEHFALGVRGYYYKQVTGDSGSGAILGDFKGESFGIGPGFFWSPKFAGGKLVVIGKWMHDLTATNRLESDYGSIAAAWKF